jgi:hypothetical protein
MVPCLTLLISATVYLEMLLMLPSFPYLIPRRQTPVTVSIPQLNVHAWAATKCTDNWITLPL